ncbi:unnamed protein product [Arabidopsis arenosa]|uniref:Uncharacterized protein n=1 Tax=Arabidopsis arenosa TaxID=38785 RepID=A0A8S1ZZJ9_ARAAE|nr:unnamed protein product [Arabidopsis arenosa]
MYQNPLPPPRHYYRPQSALTSPPRPRLVPPIRHPIVPFENQAHPSPNFHIPAALLARIVSYVAEEGLVELKNWVVAGPEAFAAVFSPETLSVIRLDKNEDFVEWAKPSSSYYNIFSMCLHHGNPYALYAQSIHYSFTDLNLSAALDNLDTIKHLLPLAKLLWIMLHSCAGTLDDQVYYEFRNMYSFNDIDYMSDTLMFHINSVGPSRCGSYGLTWEFEDFPECWQDHDWLREFNGERCLDCIYFYLSRDIMLLS